MYNPTCHSYGWKQKLGPKRFSWSLAGRRAEIFSHTDPQTVPLVSKIEKTTRDGIQVLRGFFRNFAMTLSKNSELRASGL